MFKDKQIIITNSTNKHSLLMKFSSELLNIKVYTLNEFNKLFYFDYDVKALDYIMNNYHVKYEIAKIYLNNLLYVDDSSYNSLKLNFLSGLKKELKENNLLIFNKLFRSTLVDKEIVIYNLPITKELDKLINLLKIDNNVVIYNEDKGNYKHTIYELETINKEVEWVSNEICNLIKKGIDIKHIFICNLNDEYRKLIKRIFPMFKIPYTINDQETIYGTFLCFKFLELYSEDLEQTLTNLKEYVTSSDTENIYNMISKYNISRWKIFRFYPLRKGKENEKLFYLNDFESQLVEKYVDNKQKQNQKIKIHYNNINEFTTSYFNIYPDGSIENSKDEDIGNLLYDDILNILEIKKNDLINHDLRKNNNL